MRSPHNPAPPEASLPLPSMRVSAYERVASMIVALLIMVGFVVFVLAVIAFTSRLVARPPAIQVELLEELSGRGDHPVGSAMDMYEPGVDDFPELAEPRFEELVQSVSDIVASQFSSLDTLGAHTSAGTGQGDRRQAGPLGESDVIPRSQRWEIVYPATTLEAYAKQLDELGIELGVVGGGRSAVDYITGLSNPRPRVRTVDDASEEQRLYFTWRRGQLQQFDRMLVERAGVPAAGRQILQFVPPQAEQLLAALEQAAAQGRPVRDILKTEFGVRMAGARYEYYVRGIQFRNR